MDAFAEQAAAFLAYLNAIHPFREGNGRAQLSFMTLLAAKPGHRFDLRALEPEPFLAAMIASFRGDEVALVAQVRGWLGGRSRVAFRGGGRIEYSVPQFRSVPEFRASIHAFSGYSSSQLRAELGSGGHGPLLAQVSPDFILHGDLDGGEMTLPGQVADRRGVFAAQAFPVGDAGICSRTLVISAT